MTRASARSRRAGLLVPLFSLTSSRSWGIGEIGDIAPMTRWLESAGQRMLQLLPINEMPPGETSPYSALSAMAIDPQFVSMSALEDFDAVGVGAAALPQQHDGGCRSRNEWIGLSLRAHRAVHKALLRCAARLRVRRAK